MMALIVLFVYFVLPILLIVTGLKFLFSIFSSSVKYLNNTSGVYTSVKKIDRVKRNKELSFDDQKLLR